MSDKNKILKFLIQVIGWGLVFGFPLFFTWKEGNPMTWVKFLGYVGVPIAFITVFYANYFIFIDRLLFRKRLLVFIIVNLFLFVLLSLCLHGWQEYYFIHFVNALHKYRMLYHTGGALPFLQPTGIGAPRITRKNKK